MATPPQPDTDNPQWYRPISEAGTGGIYCGRDYGSVPAPPHKGWLGNPIRQGADVRCPVCGDRHTEPGSTLDCFEEYLSGRLEEDPHFRRYFKRAAKAHIETGRYLVCYCDDVTRCHTSVIHEYMHQIHDESSSD